MRYNHFRPERPGADLSRPVDRCELSLQILEQLERALRHPDTAKTLGQHQRQREVLVARNRDTDVIPKELTQVAVADRPDDHAGRAYLRGLLESGVANLRSADQDLASTTAIDVLRADRRIR